MALPRPKTRLIMVPSSRKILPCHVSRVNRALAGVDHDPGDLIARPGTKPLGTGAGGEARYNASKSARDDRTRSAMSRGGSPAEAVVHPTVRTTTATDDVRMVRAIPLPLS